jgi:hypothetical protein
MLNPCQPKRQQHGQSPRTLQLACPYTAGLSLDESLQILRRGAADFTIGHSQSAFAGAWKAAKICLFACLDLHNWKSPRSHRRRRLKDSTSDVKGKAPLF